MKQRQGGFITMGELVRVPAHALHAVLAYRVITGDIAAMPVWLSLLSLSLGYFVYIVITGVLFGPESRPRYEDPQIVYREDK